MIGSFGAFGSGLGMMTGFTNDGPAVAFFDPQSSHDFRPVISQKVSWVSGPVMIERNDAFDMVGFHFATGELASTTFANMDFAGFSGGWVDVFADECSVDDGHAWVPSSTAQGRHDERAHTADRPIFIAVGPVEIKASFDGLFSGFLFSGHRRLYRALEDGSGSDWWARYLDASSGLSEVIGRVLRRISSVTTEKSWLAVNPPVLRSG